MSRRKSGAFGRWHAAWARQNVPESQHKNIDNWFMGKSEELVPNRTTKLVRTDHDKTPYRNYNKYRVEVVKSSAAPTSLPAGIQAASLVTMASVAAPTAGTLSSSSGATAMGAGPAPSS